MNQKLQLLNSEIIDNELLLRVEESILLDSYKASGQMLVDSDALSFIYLLEEKDYYVYLVIENKWWNIMKEGKELNLPVYLTNGSHNVLLEQFFEELNYLVENIDGNSNYGDEMENAVGAVFIEK
ncbi:UPF0738 family protein [Niallia sp. 01092]|uniref:UPF0738 family protein n=1 Tax=unclassified Niallia TaxID=2837522 RepID=UPI003FD5CA57